MPSWEASGYPRIILQRSSKDIHSLVWYSSQAKVESPRIEATYPHNLIEDFLSSHLSRSEPVMGKFVMYRLVILAVPQFDCGQFRFESGEPI